MYYRILEKFGPQDGDRWSSYLQWRGLTHLTRFDSIDGIIRPTLFAPKTEVDWQNCVNEDFRTDLITSLSFARDVFSRFQNAGIVGIEPDVDIGHTPAEGFVGYDILDGDSSVSLLTNWGTDTERISTPYIVENGLILNLERALAIKDKLRKDFSKDGHAGRCTVWAVYKLGT